MCEHVCVCVCVCIELFSFQIPNWKIVAIYAHRGEGIKEATMSYDLKKSHTIVYDLQVCCWPGKV